MTRKLYDYQRRALKWLYYNLQGGLLAGVGSGKTAVMLHLVQRLLDERMVRRILIVAPIAVCKGVWRQEALKWPKTTNLDFVLITGTPKQREKLLNSEGQIYLINYEALTWLFNLSDRPKFDLVIFDESTKLQDSSSVRFSGKGRRQNPKWTEDNNENKWLPPVKGIKHVIKEFDYVYLMTGGVKPGEYLGLWSQTYCLDQGAALGRTITQFKSDYYYRYGPAFYQIKIKSKQAEKDIQKKLYPLYYRISKKEIRAVLPKVKEIIHYVDMPPKAWKVYSELEDDFFAEIEGEPITVDTVAARSMKTRQAAQGAIYTDDKSVKHIHDDKINMLDAIDADLGDDHCLIIYSFRHDIDRLLAWNKAPILKATLPEKKFNQLQDDWNAGKHLRMYGHPNSMGHGLNLQGGGFHVIFFGIPFSADKYLQTVGRLRRSGQEADTIFVHNILCSGTIETELMLPRLKSRMRSQEEFQQTFERYKRGRHKNR